jgi:hypothetical protein
MAQRCINLAMLLALPALVPAASAFAAVRVCQDRILAAASAASEKEAKKAALDKWKEAAKARGEEFASWRLAAGRVLSCSPAPGGGFSCLAQGAPCTIEQAPNTRELRKRRLET